MANAVTINLTVPSEFQKSVEKLVEDPIFYDPLIDPVKDPEGHVYSRATTEVLVKDAQRNPEGEAGFFCPIGGEWVEVSTLVDCPEVLLIANRLEEIVEQHERCVAEERAEWQEETLNAFFTAAVELVKRCTTLEERDHSNKNVIAAQVGVIKQQAWQIQQQQEILEGQDETSWSLFHVVSAGVMGFVAAGTMVMMRR